MFQIGLIGLGPMGRSLARNISNHKYKTLVFNRTYDKTKEYIEEFGNENLDGEEDLKKFVKQIERPRKIVLLIKAGKPIDEQIEKLIPLLEPDDIIIDMANAHYEETKKREVLLKEKGIHFVGCGISGGEEGALVGPSLMPGGSNNAWDQVRPILEVIAATDFEGGPCVTHLGPDGAGHYVKMAHNGIEYSIMQSMAEAYEILRRLCKLESNEISKIFDKWNRGRLESFLFEIAVPILSKDCENKNESCLIYKILDKASQKGTGKWTSIDALDRGVAIPSITEAVYARYISGEKQERSDLHEIYKIEKKLESNLSCDEIIELLENALYLSMIINYAQGFELIERASEEENWNIDLAEVSRIWQGGCIIRSRLLELIRNIYIKENPSHLLKSDKIKTLMLNGLEKYRELISNTTKSGVATPSLTASLFYFEYMTSQRMPANFIQGLRDYFGAHTYERIDKEGNFHTDWE